MAVKDLACSCTAGQTDKAGAKFLVSPHCSEEIAAYAPGCATVTEVVKATKMGAMIIKLFPSEAIGKNFIKAVHDPLPNVNLMPSGGVLIDNVREWEKAGACAIGIGGALTEKVSEEGYQSISRLARVFVEAAN